MTPAPPSSESPWQIRDLSHALAGYIDRLGIIWVEAQIAQLTLRPGARTAYITLRDTVSELSIQAVALSSVLKNCDPPPKDGDRIIVQGKMEFHPLRGNLQIRINEIKHIGLGQLLARIETIRELLQAEGLFDPILKRPIPFLPQNIGLITGKNSAAEKDVLEVTRARYPDAQFTIINTLVQGTQASRQIISALTELDQDPQVDVIIIARGGGSVEDLLPFSDEALCRAVAAAKTPIISAIGHEPDHPLLDEVADLRAATPTDAAKRVVPDLQAELQLLNTAHLRLNSALEQWLVSEFRLIRSVSERPIFQFPTKLLLNEKTQDIILLAAQGKSALERSLDRKYIDIDYLHNQISNLSPLNVLARGYSIVTYNNKVVQRARDLKIGAEIALRLVAGKAEAMITTLEDTDSSL